MKRRILIADDEVQFLKTVRMALSLEGFDVTTVKNGTDALKELSSAWNRAEPYDLLISDIEMAGITGIELVEELEKRGFQLPVLVISGYGTKPLVRFLKTKGIVGFVDKPFDPDTLMREVTRALDSSNGQIQVATAEAEGLRRIAHSFAHELNNPLSGVLQYPQLIESRLLGDTPENRKAAEDAGIAFDKLQQFLETRKIPRYVERTISCGSRAAQIVDNMVALFCEESVRPTRIHLRELLDNSLVAMQHWADKHPSECYPQTEMDVRIPQNLPKLRCVPAMLEQVLFNIMKNAVEAMGKTCADRPPKLTIEATTGQRMMSISFRDNGPGISAELRDSIFEPFASTKRNRPTSGLGMWISRILVVEKHGGVLNMESEEGVGTTVTVCIPLALPPA